MTSSSPVVPDSARPTARRPAGAWIQPISRAIPAGVAAGIITFTPDHSALLGFLTFAGFAVVTGVAALARALFIDRGHPSTVLFAISGGVTTVAGTAALVLRAEGVGVFVAVLASWALVTGAIELSTGIRFRRARVDARDWRFAGAITVLLGILVAVVPAGYAQSFTGPDEVARTLTAAVIVVGAFGAYAAILGVFEIIAGLSLKWGTGPLSHGGEHLPRNGASR